MAIRILRPPEPLSDESRRNSAHRSAVAASSEAGTILQAELQRYCEGQIAGRSFLIAGHRGAGKTTMVNKVIDTVMKQADQGGLPMRPLQVLLHGPSLLATLPSDAPAAQARKEREAALQSAAAQPVRSALPGSAGAAILVMPSSPAKDEAPVAAAAPAPAALAADAAEELRAQVALTQIVLALHRATATEFSQRFREHLLPPASADVRADGAERAELAAQFELELLESPPASRLREFWALIGAVETGVLFTGPRPSTMQAPSAGGAYVLDQGARELVALNGICNAQQRISGVLSGQQTESANVAREWERAAGIDFKSSDTLKPLAATLSGSLVTAGAAAGQADLLVAALMGLATAFVASTMFKSSSKSGGRRERKVDRTFIPDLGVRTLDRVIPVLIARLRNAGLAPVFVIDELDKIDDLHKAMDGMIRFLKKLVAENVFTCFLTDRGYMEALRIGTREEVYGKVSSYFSQQLLLAYGPGDLDRYLDQVLVSQDDDADREILKWVLRHRSQLHALELNRLLISLRGADESCLLGPSALRDSDVYRLDATLQVVIEYHLGCDDVQRWLMQRPRLRQALFDAVYYISRAWLTDQDEIDLGKEGTDDFRASMCRRMNLDPVHSGEGLDAAEGAFLLNLVRRMARMLAHDEGRTSLLEWARRTPPPPEPVPGTPVLETLLLGTQAGLLVELSDNRYRFRYSPSGESERAAPDDLAPSTTTAHDTVDSGTRATVPTTEIDALLEAERRLDRLLGRARSVDDKSLNGSAFRLLSDDLRALPQTPPWQPVIEAYRFFERRPRGGRLRRGVAENGGRIKAYVAVLQEFAPLIEQLFITAAFFAGIRSEAYPQAMQRALGLLSEGLHFRDISSAEVVDELQDLREQLVELGTAWPAAWAAPTPPAEGPAPSPPPEEAGGNVPHELRAVFAMGRDLRSSADEADWVAPAWRELMQRLRRALARTGAGPATAFELLCQASARGPARYLPVRFDDAPLSRWTDLFFAALSPAAPRPPLEWAAGALISCGLAGVNRRVLDDFSMALPGAVDTSPASERALRDLLHEAALLPSHGAEPFVLLVVRQPQSSVSETWTQRPTKGLLLALTVEQLEQSFEWIPTALARLKARACIVVEGGVAQDTRAQDAWQRIEALRSKLPQLPPGSIWPYEAMQRYSGSAGADEMLIAISRS